MRAKLTYANVVATLALIIAVAGGSTAVALSVGKNSVQSSAIKARKRNRPELAASGSWKCERPEPSQGDLHEERAADQGWR